MNLTVWVAPGRPLGSIAAAAATLAGTGRIAPEWRFVGTRPFLPDQMRAQFTSLVVWHCRAEARPAGGLKAPRPPGRCSCRKGSRRTTCPRCVPPERWRGHLPEYSGEEWGGDPVGVGPTGGVRGADTRSVKGVRPGHLGEARHESGELARGRTTRAGMVVNLSRESTTTMPAVFLKRRSLLVS